MDELSEKIKRVFADLGIRCAYNMPSFWANGGKDYKVIPTRYAKGYQDALEDAEREITEVLSAQPEIIRCKDCKYFDPLNENVDYNFCDVWAGGTNEDMFCGFAERRQDADSSGNMSGTQKELKRTETHSCDCEHTETHDWIPVTEKLPEEDGCYLVTGKKQSVYITGYSNGRWYGGVRPIAWMPLPEPYKEGQDD